MAINTWYLIIMKSYFSELPSSLEESARIDGASDFTILIRIIIPISKPIIATFILFYGVERWNEWWYAMMYINDTKKYPRQLLLRNMIVKTMLLLKWHPNTEVPQVLFQGKHKDGYCCCCHGSNRNCLLLPAKTFC